MEKLSIPKKIRHDWERLGSPGTKEGKGRKKGVTSMYSTYRKSMKDAVQKKGRRESTFVTLD